MVKPGQTVSSGGAAWQNADSHVICIGDLALLVTDDWELEVAARDLINILDPSPMRLDGVGRKTDQLDATLGELGLKLCKSAELGGANWCVVLWMGEQNNPFVADELVEVDRAVGCLGLEVRGDGAQAETVGRVSTLCPQVSSRKLFVIFRVAQTG